MFLVKVLVLVVLLVVVLVLLVLVLLVLGVGWLRRSYPSLRRYEGRRWDPLAALGTLGFATAMYAGLSYTFPTFRVAGLESSWCSARSSSTGY